MNVGRLRVSFALVVVLSLCLAITAAGSATELVFSGRQMPDTPAGQVWVDAIAAYTAANPGMEIEYWSETNHSAHLERLYVMSAAGSPPDVIHLYNIWVPELVEQGFLHPLPENLLSQLRNELNPAALNAGEYKGTVYGVPTEFMLTGLAYNRRLLAEAGLGGPPATWDELDREATRLVAGRAGTDNPIYGMSINTGGWGWAANWHTLSKAYGVDYASEDGSLNLDSPESVSLLERFVDWGAKGWLSRRRSDFTRDNIAYFGLAFPFWASELRNQFGETFHEEIGVATMPAGPDGIGAYQYGWGLYVTAQSDDRRAEAMKFLEFLATAEAFSGTSAIGAFQATGSIPTNRRDLGSPLFADRASYFEGFLQNLPYAVSEAKLPQGESRQNILAREIDAAINMEKTPQQALLDASTQIKALLAGGN